MSDDPKANTTDDERLDEESLRRLFGEAGPRPELPEAALAQVRRGLEGAWRELQEERSRAAERATRRRRWALAAVFVGLVVFAGATVYDQWLRPISDPGSRVPPAAIALGSVDAVFGQVGRESVTGERTALSAGDPLAAGDVLTSEGTSRARLRLVSGHGVRLDQASRIRLEGPDRLVLEEGAVYLESDPERRHAVAVAAAGAVTRELGTRFEVRLLPSATPGDGIAQALSVRVREGVVVTERGATTARSEAGMQHVLHPSGEVTTTRIATHGPEWVWVSQIAAPFVVEGSTLRQYLDWVAKEGGLRVAFESPAEEAAASTITLHGTLGNLSPAASVEVMLPAAGFEGRLDAGVLRVRRADR